MTKELPDTPANRVLLILVSALLGVVITGAAMLIRSDVQGARAADAVESRVNMRVDRLESQYRMDLKDVKDALVRIENKIDENHRRR